MSDRFSGLRENIKNQKNREKNRGEKNNYRNKDKHGFNQKKNKNNKNDTNIFIKERKSAKDDKIDISEKSFPSLNPDIAIEKPKLNNYLEMTKKLKEEEEKKKINCTTRLDNFA